MIANIVRQNLQVVLAANQAVELEGDLSVTNYIDGTDENRILAAREICEMDDSTAAALADWELDPGSWQADEGNRGRRAAVLSCVVHGRTARLECPDTSDEALLRKLQWDEWALIGPPILAELRAHQTFLSGLGFLISLDEGKWKEPDFGADGQRFERQPSLWVVAILKSPVESPDSHGEHPAEYAFQELCRLSEWGVDGHGMLLRAFLFPLKCSPTDIVQSSAIEPDRIIQLADQWERCGRKYTIFANTGEQRRVRTKNAQLEFLVPGLVPFGLVTLLAARNESGKTTLMHELAVAAGTPCEDAAPREWIGIPLATHKAGGIVAFISGEDSDDLLDMRTRVLDPEDGANQLMSSPCSKEGFKPLLQSLAGLPNLRLVIVDPVRKFTDGSEDQSATISEFFDELESLARATGCAVIAVHHLSKGANPRNLGELMQRIRGSGVFADRPRVVLGMYLVRGQTYLGVAKSNIPPGCGMIAQPIALIRDVASLRHLPVAVASANPASTSVSQPASAGASSAQESVDLLGAIKRLIAENKTVTRTGPKSPFGWKPAELNGYSRAVVDQELNSLINAGSVVVQDGHLRLMAGNGKAAVR